MINYIVDLCTLSQFMTELKVDHYHIKGRLAFLKLNFRFEVDLAGKRSKISLVS